MHPIRNAAMAGLVAAALLTTPLLGVANAATVGTGGGSYTVGMPVLDQVAGAPWLTSQGDPSVGAPYANSLPTYTPPASGTPNLALYPGAGNNASGVAGTPGPVDGYCGAGGPNPESGAINTEPAGDLPMAPYYFPDVVRANATTLVGYFDYRPKDTDEAVSVATSTNNGATWTSTGEVLEQDQGWCANGDSNDNGQGHPFVMTVNGNSYLYTLSRPTGDYLGVNMLVHPLDTADASDPLDKLPASQPVGVDPDQTASATVAIPATGGTGATINLGSIGVGPEQLVAGPVEDLALASPQSSVITCTAVAGNSLTGCTTANAGGVTVSNGDTIEQVVASVATGGTIPTATTTASTAGLTFGAYTSASIESFVGANASPGGRFSINGNPVYCVEGSSPYTSWTQCSTPDAAFTATAGAAITTDPVVPVGVTQTNGLISPDGIVGIVPNYPGTPAGDVAVMYGEKIDSYFAEQSTTAKVTLPAAGTAFTLPVTSTSGISTPVSLTLGDNTSGGFVTANCTSETATSFGCTSTTGGDSISNASLVGIPGACAVASSTLAQTGEGNTKSTALYKNNEDFTVLRVAFTSDGINFTDGGIVDSGQDLSNPAATASPSATSPLDLPQGATDTPGLRFVGSRGTVVTNSDGSLGLFMSGAWCTDGDSDSFNQIFYSQSTNNGSSWSTPQVVLSTDYTFSARQQQDAAATPTPLNISGYYSGRVYGPTVVQNSDGSLTMVFAGYGTPKPLPAVGAMLGNQAGGAPQWTVGVKDPALYRDILTVTLTPQPTAVVPESPVNAALPASAALVLAGGWWLTRRRRRASARRRHNAPKVET